MVIHEVIVDPILQVPFQEPPVSSKYGYEGQKVLEKLSIVLKSSNPALTLKGGVVEIGGVADIVGTIF